MTSARPAVAATFAINGLLYGAWAARIPAIRDRLSLSPGQLGIALACIALGSVLAMPACGWASARWGSRRTTRAGLLAFAAATGTVALAPSLAALCALCLLMGAAAGWLDVAMNAHGVAVERHLARPVFSSLHAAFSLGGLAGAASGALAAALGIDPRAQLAAMAVAAAAVGGRWTRRLLHAGADTAPRHRTRRAWPTGRLGVLGALAFACLLSEGAAADWSGVYTHRSLGASGATAALAYAAFSAAMASGRLAGDRLTARVGPVALVRRGATLAAAGLGAGLLVHAPAASLAGFACLGIGLATVIPTVFRAAASQPLLPPGPGLATVSTCGYLGFLAGPPAIGFLAEAVGLPTALAVLPLLCLAVAALAGSVRLPSADLARDTAFEPALR